MYPISQVRGKISIGILKRFAKNRRIWIKKRMTANLCQLIKGKIAIISASHKKIKGSMTKKTSGLLTQRQKKKSTEMMKAFRLKTSQEIREPSAHDLTTAKSRKRGYKDVVTSTMRDNFVVERRAMVGNASKNRLDSSNPKDS